MRKNDHVHTRISKVKMDKLRKIVDRQGLTISHVVEQAIDRVIENKGARTVSNK